MSEDNISISIFGIDKAIFVAHEIGDIPINAIMPTVRELMDLGVKAGRKTLIETARSEKSTGETARLMTGIVQAGSRPGEARITIGPATAGLRDPNYPKFVETGSAAGVSINRNVQLLPYPLRWGFEPLGRWRWIGERQTEIVPHPWMTNIMEVMSQETARLFGKRIYEAVGELRRKASGAPREAVITRTGGEE